MAHCAIMRARGLRGRFQPPGPVSGALRAFWRVLSRFKAFWALRPNADTFCIPKSLQTPFSCAVFGCPCVAFRPECPPLRFGCRIGGFGLPARPKQGIWLPTFRALVTRFGIPGFGCRDVSESSYALGASKRFEETRGAVFRFRHMTKIAMGEPRAASVGKSSPRNPHWRFSSLKYCPRSPARAPRRKQQGDDFTSAPITSAPSGPSRPSRAARKSSALARAGAPRLSAQGFRASFRASALRQTPSSHIDFGKCHRMLRAYFPRLARKGFRAILPRASRAIFADRFRERSGVVFQTAAVAGLSDFGFAISPSAASR